MVIISNQVYRGFFVWQGRLVKIFSAWRGKNSWVIVVGEGGRSVPKLTLCIRREELFISHMFKANKITIENILSLGKRFYSK